MKEDYVDNLLTEMESRVAAMEERLFGDDVGSKSQQKRQVGGDIYNYILGNAKGIVGQN